MNIIQMLSQKAEDVSADEIIKQLVETMAKIRGEYGNAESKVPVPDVETTHGRIAFSGMDAESQVAIARTAATKVKFAAIEAVRQNPALSIEKVSLELLATNEFLVNVGVKAVSTYL
jgi:hypothetical protein